MIKLKVEIILFNKTITEQNSKLDTKNAIRREVQAQARPSFKILRVRF